MNERDTKNLIREFVLRTFPLARKNQISDSDSLLTSGIVDSMGVLDVVNFLESELKISIADEEMLADHFESIEQIAQFVDASSQKTAD